jgi:phytoene synthase
VSQRTRLDESYRQCRQVVLRARSNLGRAFWLLPAEQRRGMDALYAFARQADDIVDGASDVEAARIELQDLQSNLNLALTGAAVEGILPAVADTIRRFQISPAHFDDLLQGVEMDLDRSRYATWDELHEYCRRVASTVGLACIAIWGCRDDDAHQPAVDCGLALQLTNILRDVREDAQRGRIYLPLEDLARFQVTEQQLLAGEATPAACELIRFQIARARTLYDSAALALPLIPQPARRLFWLMHTTYYRLLCQIEERPEAVFQRRVQLSWHTKLWLATRATLGL